MASLKHYSGSISDFRYNQLKRPRRFPGTKYPIMNSKPASTPASSLDDLRALATQPSFPRDYQPPIKIHALNTGFLTAWLSEHPDGPIVVDTGENIRAQNDPTFFPPTVRPFYNYAFRFQMHPEDEIGPQLRALGFPPEDIKTIILTHAHMDHSDGLHHFPNANILISAREWRDAMRSNLHGALTTNWPKDMKIQHVNYVPEAIGPFEQSFPVTADGKVRIIPTPGHTMGHQSVVIEDKHGIYFIAGDVSFTEGDLISYRVDSVTHNASLLRQTRAKIYGWSYETALVYLPSHDMESVTRLQNNTPTEFVFAEG
jgi:glyoxylase-like metal-dependent hydrolase (beta-lactamase superfamily II)